MTRARFSYSEIRGSKLAWQLPAAYRSLQRPSSASSAKASTGCPLQLAETMLALAMEFSRVDVDPCPAPEQTNNSWLSGSPPDPARPRPDHKGAQTATFKAAQCAHANGTTGSRPVMTALASCPPGGVRVPSDE